MKQVLIKSVIILALFGFDCNLNIKAARSAKFDIMTYSVPQGYSTQDRNDAKVFVRKNTATGKFSLIFLYPSTGSFGNANTDFDRRWKQLVSSQAKSAPEKSVVNGSGYSGIAGYSPIDYDSNRAAAILITITTKGRLITLLSITNDENGAKDFEKFLSKVDVDTDAIAAAAPAAPRKKTTQQAVAAPNSGNSTSITQQQLLGRWVTGSGYRASDGAGGIAVGSTTSNGGYLRDYIFQSDGTFINQTYSKKTNGKYNISGNIITLNYSDGKVERYRFKGFDNEYGRLFMRLSMPTNSDPNSYSNYYQP
jgi:hypothetical protein